MFTDLLFSLFIFFLSFKQGRDILFCNLEFLGFITKPPVLRIRLLLSCKKFRILSVQIFHPGDLLYTKFVKSLFGSFMKSDFLSVCFKELFAVSCFSIGFISSTSLGIVDDVLFQGGDLCQSGLRCSDRGQQRITFPRLVRCQGSKYTSCGV